MGSGITQRFLQAEYQVICVETDADRAARTASAVSSGLRRRAAKAGHLKPLDEMTGRLAIHVGGAPGADPQLVIETVPENAGLKHSVLAEYSARYPDVTIASNTSALSIGDLARSVRHPGRFLGMHFFNPVPVSALIEVVHGPQTGEDAIEAAHQHARRLGLTPVVVRDSPGFATSRLGIAIGLEAIRMVEEKVASPADIDTAMVLGYRLPVGPLELSDRVGLDVRLAIAQHLHAALGERFRPPALLGAMVRDGLLGAKTGQGFYTWDGGKKVPGSPVQATL
jgi:3-hydroxybutyryl-CoA dehydrogenase